MANDEKKPIANGVDLEWSHDRVRTVVRTDQVPALPSAEPVPIPRGESARFGKGNQAWRLRQTKEHAEGIATLNPDKAPSWLKPYIEMGAAYISALLLILEGRPALAPLAGDCADAHVMYRACLALAIAAEGKERAELLAEARGWLKEHRTALATLSKLAGDIRLPKPKQDLGSALAEGAEASAS